MGTSTVAFLRDVYARAKAAGKFKMTQQPEMKYTWNTMAASSFWDMHLSVACTAADAQFQNRIIIRDCTMYLPVVARQPHPDPNHAPHGAAPARSRSAEPKGINRPGTSAGSQPPQAAWGVTSLTGRHLNSPMLSALSFCQHDLRTQSLVAHPPLRKIVA